MRPEARGEGGAGSFSISCYVNEIYELLCPGDTSNEGENVDYN